MQTANANPPVSVTFRHMEVSDALKDYAEKKIEGLHLDYPRIIEAQIILDVEKYRQIAEVILHCSNHITIDATAETDDMYASLDEVMSKIARRMRKHKTKMLRQHRPRKGQVRELEEQVFTLEGFEEAEETQPTAVQTEKYPVRPMYVDEAMLQLEMSSRQFVVFLNADDDKINIVYRRRNGEFGLIEPVIR